MKNRDKIEKDLFERYSAKYRKKPFRKYKTKRDISMDKLVLITQWLTIAIALTLITILLNK